MTLNLDIRIKYLQEGKSRRGLADEIDVPEAVLRRFEGGKGVHPKHALPIAEYLGVNVTDLPQFAAVTEQTA
ncbi:helix-turn-helix domain-containing protein [Patulibacter minatonensis]|uniref:helix-turn-helix domain-containing protein n=1 Tax=Patulibacter minatonensis TaxID=298163 RepID=UPI00047C9256|nr:helix-turn-helix transcriptional regulator [Patulibacter minatonensis]